ncbi:MAG: hypothetical protein R3C00_08945 [Hyphomonas sp.]|nr:hypothetical protein [Hyphomonas sp.]
MTKVAASHIFCIAWASCETGALGAGRDVPNDAENTSSVHGTEVDFVVTVVTFLNLIQQSVSNRDKSNIVFMRFSQRPAMLNTP